MEPSLSTCNVAQGKRIVKMACALINSRIFISSRTEAPLPEPLIIAIAGPLLLLCFVPFEVGWLKLKAAFKAKISAVMNL